MADISGRSATAEYLRTFAMSKAPNGFTLIELMIAVAVVSILAAVAYPSYQDHIRKSRRAEAQSFMMAVAARQQQFLVDTRGYGESLSDVGVPTPDNVARAYAVELAASAAPSPSFVLTATPRDAQARERCGTLSIDQNGSKSAAHSSCW